VINIVINSLGSGDWIVVKDTESDAVLFEGHRITPLEFASILEQLGTAVDIVEVTDEQMEEGAY
jgi:pyruvate/2-oxoglutarate dehydrogenase complex dihydrolipoamide dehydrogenase (E3) component